MPDPANVATLKYKDTLTGGTISDTPTATLDGKAVAISPAGGSPEKSPEVAEAVKVIRESGLPSETNAMFTNIEGDLDEVLHVVADATRKLAERGMRTDVVMRLDIRPGFTGQIKAKQALVNAILSE